MCVKISFFHKMISAGILALFVIFNCEACSPIPTTEQQQFCSAQYGKFVLTKSFFLFYHTVFIFIILTLEYD